MSFTAASYNILADSYIRPERYPGVPPAFLTPGWRRPALLRRLRDLAVDVLCLQEVEAEVFRAALTCLEPLGYQGHFLRKGGDKPDGCATFVRRQALRVRDVRLVLYFDHAGNPLRPSGHGALILLLEQDGRALAVANTHLKWDPPETRPDNQWGFRQVGLLLGERRELGPAYPSWVVVGDFNATPDSAAVALLRQASFRDAYHDRPTAFTCNANRRARRIDYLFHTADLHAEPIDPPPLADDTPLPSEQEPSDHLPVRAQFFLTGRGEPPSI